ncbi:MAG: biotin--[acetyl-CoA-carboxylase] ligase [Planctomycetota bacterium]|jgi:BirA family biotin operon repressor/biotin-[acetyl-CoA-carboxylase] ligase
MNTNLPLDVDVIEESRSGQTLGRKVVLFKETASTNDIAWAYATGEANHGLCVLAEAQSAGRGRRGRTWLGQAGQSILCSVLLMDQTVEAELLTLSVAVAAAEAIGKACNIKTRIKWPNDLLVSGKKLAGVLVETKTIGKRQHFVIGIGINCNQTGDAFEGADLNLPATSIAMETGKLIDRNKLVSAFLGKLEGWIARDAETTLKRWQQLSTLLGHHITVECDRRQFSGFCRGIDPTEGLILHLDSGVVRMFGAGQTSIQRIE